MDMQRTNVIAQSLALGFTDANAGASFKRAVVESNTKLISEGGYSQNASSNTPNGAPDVTVAMGSSLPLASELRLILKNPTANIKKYLLFDVLGLIKLTMPDAVTVGGSEISFNVEGDNKDKIFYENFLKNSALQFSAMHVRLSRLSDSSQADNSAFLANPIEFYKYASDLGVIPQKRLSFSTLGERGDNNDNVYSMVLDKTQGHIDCVTGMVVTMQPHSETVLTLAQAAHK